MIKGGEPLLGFAPVIKYPFYSDELGQLFPYRTASMIGALMMQVVASLCATFLFRNVLPSGCDFLRCFSSPGSLDRHTCHRHQSKRSAPSTDAGLLPSKSLNIIQRTIRIPRAIFRKGSNRYTRKQCDLNHESLHL